MSSATSHGLVTPTDIDGAPNPYYDDLEGNGTPDGRIASAKAISAARIRSRCQAGAGAILSSNATVFAASDHGFAPQWYA